MTADLRDGRHLVSTNVEPAPTTIGHGYASASDAGLQQATFVLAAGEDRGFSITYC